MYSLFKGVAARKFLGFEASSLAASLAIAELFYKFHSFTLEAIGFLGTWYLLNLLLHLLFAAGTGRKLIEHARRLPLNGLFGNA